MQACIARRSASQVSVRFIFLNQCPLHFLVKSTNKNNSGILELSKRDGLTYPL